MKTCSVCQQTKELSNFGKAGTYNGKIMYRGECYDCNRLKQKTPERRASEKKYKTSAKGKKTRSIRRKQEDFRAKERIADKHRYYFGTRKKSVIDWINKKLEEDPLFRLKFYLRNRLKDSIKNKSWKKTTSFTEAVGCSIEELKAHIECQFKPGMTWENYGAWEIDHIYPLARATDVDHMYKLAHYTNLQPLWREENRLKSDKI